MAIMPLAVMSSLDSVHAKVKYVQDKGSLLYVALIMHCAYTCRGPVCHC